MTLSTDNVLCVHGLGTVLGPHNQCYVVTDAALVMISCHVVSELCKMQQHAATVPGQADPLNYVICKVLRK